MELTDADIGLELTDADIGLEGDVSVGNQPRPLMQDGIISMPPGATLRERPRLTLPSRSLNDKLNYPPPFESVFSQEGMDYVKDVMTTPTLPLLAPQPDAGFAEQLGTALQHGLAGGTAPIALPLAPMMSEQLVGRAIATLTKMGLAGQGAAGIGQAAGTLAGTPEPTGADYGQATGDVLLNALMTVPFIAKTMSAGRKAFNPVLEPEIVGPGQSRPVPRGPRQLQEPPIDVESSVMRGNELPPASRFIRRPEGKLQDMTDLTAQEQSAMHMALRQAAERDAVAMARKRPAQAAPVIIGQQEPAVVPPLIVPGQVPAQVAPLVTANQPSGQPKQGGQISFEGQGIPNARQQAMQSPFVPMVQATPVPPMAVRQPVDGGSVLPPENPSYRPPMAAPTQEQYAARQRRLAVERGLTIPEVPMEPLSEEVAQFPEEGMPKGTLSNLQRDRIVAGQPNVRSNVRNNPPSKREWQVTVQAPQPLAPGKEVPGYVQIDDVAGGQNNWSKSPATLKEEGVDVPDFSKLPQGKYSYEQAVNLTESGKMTIKLPDEIELALREAEKRATNGEDIESIRAPLSHVYGYLSDRTGGDAPKSAETEARHGSYFDEVNRRVAQIDPSNPALTSQAPKETVAPVPSIPVSSGAGEQAVPVASAPVKGLGVKAALAKGQAKRKETGALMPSGKEGRMSPTSSHLQSVRVLQDQKRLGFGGKAKVAGQQLWNRLKNVMGTGSSELKVLEETTGVGEFLKEARTPMEVAEYVAENGPRVEVHSYGMEGKVSALEQEAATYRHSWYDGLDSKSQAIADGYVNNVNHKDIQYKQLQSFAKEQGTTEPKAKELLDKWVVLRDVRSKAKGPRATSAYSHVSAFPTTEPMPEWTTSKEGKNVQRVDVVVPHRQPNLKDPRAVSTSQLEREAGVMWQPDNLHENLPNTLGWAMIQYKTGPKGEKIAVVVEAQSRWGQYLRQVKTPNDVFGGNMASHNRQKTIAKLDHPLLRDYNRLILKAAIEQAKKEGATHIAISDGETAMMTEGHDSSAVRELPADPYNPSGKEEVYNIPQEPGMRLNYDKVLPGIAEELTGMKGEVVELGEHKNAFEQGQSEGQSFRIHPATPRKDLIFRKADGTPKTSVTARMYPLTRATDFTIMGTDKPAKTVETSKGLGVKAALEKNQQKKEGGSISLEPIRETGKAIANAVRLYSEPIVERLGRLGGPVSKKVSEEANQIVSRAKGHYGALTPVLDVAKKAASKALRGGTTWVRQVRKVTDKAATNNFFGANERTATVPTGAQDMLTKTDAANLAIGRLAQQASPGFVASGKLQRMMTAYGIDVVRRGSGPAWDAWTEGVAVANGKPLVAVRAFYRKWKNELDKPGADVASLNKMNQDFVREYPNTITHVKPGNAWHEVIVSDPFNYLEAAAQRTAHAVAFREVYKPGSGLLEKTREAVMRELPTDRHEKEFDNLIRALQGMPTDSYTSAWNAPDSISGGIARMATQTVVAPIKAMVLTGNFITNVAESVVGGPAIFLGYKNVLPAMAQLSTTRLAQQLEMTGARNLAMYNNAFDPTSPVRSMLRMGSNAIRTASFQQVMNELQEATAAASAKVAADRMRAGLKPGEQEQYTAVLRAMGMTEANARKAIAGDAALLAEFERKAAAWLTGGNQSMGERSRLGASRIFNELFWFHNYPMMTMNQFRSVAGNFAEAIGNKNWKQAKANANLLSRLVAGKTLQGILMTALIALAYEGIHGVQEKANEAKDETTKFMLDVFFASMGGPLAVMKRTLEKGGDSQQLQESIAATVTPLGIGKEIFDMSAGFGRYEGRGGAEKVGMFLESKTPGFRIMKTGMALAGLSSEDQELNAAVKGFYRWRNQELGRVESRRFGEEAEAGAPFRAQMRRVTEALREGKDWRKELEGAGDRRKVFQSLLSRQILKSSTGGKLTDEQMESLRGRIGEQYVNKLVAYDAMLRQVAYGLIDREPPEEREEREPSDSELPPL